MTTGVVVAAFKQSIRSDLLQRFLLVIQSANRRKSSNTGHNVYVIFANSDVVPVSWIYCFAETLSTSAHTYSCVCEKKTKIHLFYIFSVTEAHYTFRVKNNASMNL